MKESSTSASEQARYAVRQVLYLIARDGRPEITPVQVTEEIRRTTLEGTVVMYAVRTAGDHESFVLDERYEVFPSIEAVRSELGRRAAIAIDAMVNAAAAEAAAAFVSNVTVSQPQSNTSTPATPVAGIVSVQLPDGQIVRMRADDGGLSS